MSTWYVPDPQQRCEEVLLAYASSSFSASGLIDPSTNWYVGMSQEDKYPPAVLVACNSADETYFQSRVYAFDVDITTKQIAWDSTTSSASTGSIINLGGNIHALFGDSITASLGINQLTGAAANDFWIYQVQQLGYQSERVEDSWISNQKLKVIGALALATANFLPAVQLV